MHIHADQMISSAVSSKLAYLCVNSSDRQTVAHT